MRNKTATAWSKRSWGVWLTACPDAPKHKNVSTRKLMFRIFLDLMFKGPHKPFKGGGFPDLCPKQLATLKAQARQQELSKEPAK